MTAKLIAFFQTIIIMLVPVIAFLYWLAFGYGNHVSNITKLLTYI